MSRSCCLPASRVPTLVGLLAVVCGPGLASASVAAVQEDPPRAVRSEAALRRPITITFVDAPIRDVLFAFAEFADRSIVPGAAVEGLVSAEIRDQPWDVALDALLESRGLVATERADGMILVERLERVAERETRAPLETRAIRAVHAGAEELQELVLPILTERGRVAAGPVTNTLVVTDIPRVVREVEALVREVDVPARQVDIAAKIVFVNRSRLSGLGITYDLKDTEGNQLNLLTPGIADLDGSGAIDLPDEVVPTGTNVISLGGSSVAALGNATARIPGPTLSLLASLAMGRRTLIAFIDALESAQLTDVEARPSVRVMHNRTARIVVGEETPVRVLDAGAQSQSAEGVASAGYPVATVDYKETGVILEVAPRVTTEGDVLLALSAERSSADIAPSDVGYVFRRQKAESEVLVRDGETVVIGGLAVAEAAEIRSGIPWLMDLPVVGRLFRTHQHTVVERELLILVTPSVVPLAPSQ